MAASPKWRGSSDVRTHPFRHPRHPGARPRPKSALQVALLYTACTPSGPTASAMSSTAGASVSWPGPCPRPARLLPGSRSNPAPRSRALFIDHGRRHHRETPSSATTAYSTRRHPGRHRQRERQAPPTLATASSWAPGPRYWATSSSAPTPASEPIACATQRPPPFHRGRHPRQGRAPPQADENEAWPTRTCRILPWMSWCGW